MNEPKNSSNYFIYSNDTIDMSKSYEFLIKLVYNDTILYSVTESGDISHIFNSFRLREEGLYLDSINQKYFLTGFLELKKYLNDDVTYELITILVGYEIFEGGRITW